MNFKNKKWEVVESVVQDNYWSIIEVTDKKISISHHEIANTDNEKYAELIATLPLLYKALKASYDWLKEEYPTAEPITIMKQALTKIERG